MTGRREVTVLMSVYNGMPYLGEAVESILAQSFEDFTFLIVDDGSTDGSGAYLGALTDERVELIRQENAGLGAALNRGLDTCTTPFVARMDADDLCDPTRLEKQIDFLRAHPEVAMLGTQFGFFSGTGGALRPSPLPMDHETITRILKAGGHSISHPTIMFRTERLRAVGAYRITGPGQDWDLFHRMSEKARCANLPDLLYRMRVHDESTAWRNAVSSQLGAEYACHAARCRARDEDEPGFEDFRRDWQQGGALRRSRTIRRAQATRQYRQATVDFLHGRRLRGIARLLLAACANPNKLRLRILKQLKRAPQP